MSSQQETRAQIARLKAAIGTGTLEVRDADGKSRRYQSTQAMIDAVGFLEGCLEQEANPACRRAMALSMRVDRGL